MLFWMIEDEKARLKVERLYVGYRRLMYQEAYRILNDHHDAEDALHESFIRISGGVGKIDENDISGTRSFLVTVCRNVAKDIYKKKKRMSCNYEILENAVDDKPLVEEVIINHETMTSLAQAVEALKEEYRDVYILRTVYDLSRKEIAELFGLKPETVKKRLTRARAAIVKSMKGEMVQ